MGFLDFLKSKSVEVEEKTPKARTVVLEVMEDEKGIIDEFTEPHSCGWLYTTTVIKKMTFLNPTTRIKFTLYFHIKTRSNDEISNAPHARWWDTEVTTENTKSKIAKASLEGTIIAIMECDAIELKYSKLKATIGESKKWNRTLEGEVGYQVYHINNGDKVTLSIYEDGIEMREIRAFDGDYRHREYMGEPMQHRYKNPKEILEAYYGGSIIIQHPGRQLLFFDGEFTKLTTTGVRFLSMAFITEEGKELYLEISQPVEEVDPWVKENVIPYLNGTPISEEEAKEQIQKFISENYDDKPVIVADVNQFDWNGLCHLFGTWDIPFFYIPIDFSTILFTKGIDIDVDREELAKEYGIDVSGFKKHNALSDTRVLFKCYQKLTHSKIS